MKEQILRLLKDHSESETNLSSEAGRELLTNQILDIIKKKLSKHKKNLIKRFRWIIIPITLPNVKINIIDNIIIEKN